MHFPLLLCCSVNSAFISLRELIPTEPKTRKLSKIETLRLAKSYIEHLAAMLVTGKLFNKPICWWICWWMLCATFKYTKLKFHRSNVSAMYTSTFYTIGFGSKSSVPQYLYILFSHKKSISITSIFNILFE